MWSLEPEGEAEKPEATGVGSEVKGFSANLPTFRVYGSEGWKEALLSFESVMATVGRMVFPDFRCVHEFA